MKGGKKGGKGEKLCVLIKMPSTRFLPQYTIQIKTLKPNVSIRIVSLYVSLECNLIEKTYFTPPIQYTDKIDTHLTEHASTLFEEGENRRLK